MNNSSKIKQAWATRLAQGNFDITGTLNFNDGSRIGTDKAKRLFKAYWHKVDRIYFGHASETGAGVDRWCFAELGRSDTNIHMHFVARAPIQADVFCCTLNALWSGFHCDTAPLASNWITPVINIQDVARYVVKETRHDREDTIGPDCSHRPTMGYDASFEQAQVRRIQNSITADEFEQALAALPLHIMKTKARIEARRLRTR